jgi:hypothetical protein
LEHDDMANEHSSAKSIATDRKPLGTRTPSPQLPQIHPPLLMSGPEMLRDSNC